MLNLIADLYYGAVNVWPVTLPVFLVAFGVMLVSTIRDENR